jgi:NADH-quinone oxidoreductase subunit M
MVIGGCYSLWLFNRIIYGNLKTQYFSTYLDITKREFLIFLPLLIGTLVMGVYPSVFLDSIHFSVNMLIELMYF